MKKPYTVVQFTTHILDGDTLHRRTWPMQALASLPEFRVIDVHYHSPYAYQLAFDADLLILGTTREAELIPIMRWRRARGKPTVHEPDNYVFDLDPWNPAFEEWNSPVVQAYCLQVMGLADLVQATTLFLAETFRPHCSQVAVFPNQLPGVPHSLPPNPDAPLVVGWAGTNSHMADVARIAPAISQWILEHNDVMFSFMGAREIAELFVIPPERKRVVPQGNMDAYERFLTGLHIGLAPLRDTRFNRGRSDAKWLEYALNGCVFVGQRLLPYTDSVQDGKTGFLFDDTRELLRIMDRLYQDRALMASVRRAAFDYVAAHRQHHHHIQHRATVYRDLLERKPPEGGEKWNLHELATFPRINLPEPLPEYLPLKLQADEENALADLYSTRTDPSEAPIQLVEKRYGHFHLTCYSRARLALSQDDLSAAEQHLRRSLSFYPAAIESLSLLGQILLSMQRFKEARDMLSLATQWYPACIGAYRHLADVAEHESDWATAITVTHDWEKHCSRDPWACLRRGILMIQAGRQQEGMEVLSDAMSRLTLQLKYWQRPLASEVVHIFRWGDELLARESRASGGKSTASELQSAWSDLIVQAAEMFPYGLWLPARAGAICFERGDYQRGARILQRARERLLACEWQRLEGGGAPQQYRGIIEAYRTACEELA